MSLLDDVSIVVTPNGYKAGVLYSAIPSSGAADLEVVRATAATRVDENGLVNYAEIIGSEEITNGDFADWTADVPDSWFVVDSGDASSNVTQNPTGQCQIISDGTLTYIQQNSLVSGVDYRLQYDITNYVSGVLLLDLTVDIPLETSVGSYSVDFTAKNIALVIKRQGTCNVTIDNISVKEVTRDNVPRIDYSGGGCPHILAEPQRTNFVYPSAVATTQTRTVTATAYTLSFYGTGNIVLSGTHSATLTGTGVNDRVDLTFTPTAGSLTLTVSGTVTNFQLEVGSYATSYIPNINTALGVTRVQDQFSRDGISSLIGQTEGTLVLKISKPTTTLAAKSVISFNNAASNSDDNSISIGFNNSDDLYIGVKSAGADVFLSDNIPATANTFYLVAISYKTGVSLIYVDGSPITPNTGLLSNAFTFGETLDNLSFDADGNGVSPFYGWVELLNGFKTVLTTTQLAALTS